MLTDKQKHRYYIKKYACEVKHLEGVFIECGVKYGTASIVLAKELNKYGYLFDTWGKFKGLGSNDGSKRWIRRVKKRNFKNIKRLCAKALKKNNVAQLCNLIQGNVLNTIPCFVKNNPEIKIVFLHLDLDVYLPTKICLSNLWENVVDGGVVLIHDYGSKKWKGIKKCVDEFFDTLKIEVNKLDIDACLIRKI